MGRLSAFLPTCHGVPPPLLPPGEVTSIPLTDHGIDIPPSPRPWHQGPSPSHHAYSQFRKVVALCLVLKRARYTNRNDSAPAAPGSCSSATSSRSRNMASCNLSRALLSSGANAPQSISECIRSRRPVQTPFDAAHLGNGCHSNEFAAS
jgi:hypothetical protein